MAKEQLRLTVLFMILSVILFVAAAVWFTNRIIKRKNAPEKYNRAGIGTALGLSGFLILSIWLLRFAVGYFTIVTAECRADELTPLEEVMNSLFGALRTFSMEEEYKEYILDIKTLIAEIVPDVHWGFSVIQSLAVAYASLLNFIAPIIGGAIILEILASIFPKFRLKWSYLSKRPKYFFSELNAASLALAKSIYNEENDKKPIFIFTDTYVDDEEEKEYELLLEAKKYGAICVRDDLAHVKKVKSGIRSYYLMDENEFGNLQTLLCLTEDHNVEFIKDSQIYLFVNSDAYVQIEKQINKEFDESEKKKALLKGGEKPLIVPVNGYRNLVHNLLVDVPLYEPLINNAGKTKLSVTILGNGIIGTEAFLSTYWSGQMLVSDSSNNEKTISECELAINVVSKDKENVFWSKIDYINPEIKKTMQISDSGLNDDILCNDGAGNKNNAYCKVKYIEADVKIGGFWDSNTNETKDLLESDYFIVALGNDSDNISVAEKLRRLIGKKHLEEVRNDKVGNVVISYAVFNSNLANVPNSNKHYCCREKGKSDIFMHAFGSLEQVYSCDNVYMSKYKLLAEGIGAAYDRTQMREKHVEEHKNRGYSYWSDLTRAMHIKYKAFSLGLIKQSVFDFVNNGPTWNEDYNEYVKKQCGIYKETATVNSKKEKDDTEKSFDKINAIYSEDYYKQVLAWLEHRRWNAFIRTQGFQHTNEFRKNFQLNGKDHKNMELKLHPCLVEAKKPDLNGGKVYLNETVCSLFKYTPPKHFDSEKIKSCELSTEEMKALLEDKKVYLIDRLTKVSQIQTDKLDFLDKLSCEWCKESTPVSIELIEKALNDIGNSNPVATEKQKVIFKKAWSGISSYDFKIYDYFDFDYDE